MACRHDLLVDLWQLLDVVGERVFLVNPLSVDSAPSFEDGGFTRDGEDERDEDVAANFYGGGPRLLWSFCNLLRHGSNGVRELREV